MTTAPSYPIQQRQRVFLAYRSLFKNQDALIRQRRKIQQRVHTYQQSTKTLIRELGEGNVINILKSLLEEEIFSSELKAKRAFPSLFQTTAAQDAQHAASEVGALQEEARELERARRLELERKVEVGKERDTNGNTDAATSVDNIGGEDNEFFEKDVWEDIEEIITDHQAPPDGDKAPSLAPVQDSQLPSLYPLYIPFRAQHQILTRVQRLLEEGCFEFSSKWTPDLLERKKWDCSEAIELNQWIGAMKKAFRKLPADALGSVTGGEAGAEAVFLSVNKLRHTAVHRLRLTANGIKDIIQKAMTFAATLRDTVRECQLNELHLELHRTIGSMELHKNFLETRLQEEFDEITRLRMELDKREADAIATTMKEDKENNSMAGSLLEELLGSILDRDGQPNTPLQKHGDEADKADGEEPQHAELEIQPETQAHDEVVVGKPIPDEPSVQEMLELDVPKKPNGVQAGIWSFWGNPLTARKPKGEESTTPDEPKEVIEEASREESPVEQIPALNPPKEADDMPCQEWTDNPVREQCEAYSDEIKRGEPEISRECLEFKPTDIVPLEQLAEEETPGVIPLEPPVEEDIPETISFGPPAEEEKPEAISYGPPAEVDIPETISFGPPVEEDIPDPSNALPSNPLLIPTESPEMAIEPEVDERQEAAEPESPSSLKKPDWLVERLRQQSINKDEGTNGSASPQDPRILLSKLVESISAAKGFERTKMMKKKKPGVSQARIDELKDAVTDIWAVLNEDNDMEEP